MPDTSRQFFASFLGASQVDPRGQGQTPELQDRISVEGCTGGERMGMVPGFFGV